MCTHATKRLEKCDPYSKQVQFSIRGFQRIPADARGVYGIWFRRRCIYVGKAGDQSISERLVQHWKRSHNERFQAWIEAKGSRLRVAFLIVTNPICIDAYERLCINRFQPIANQVRYKQKGIRKNTPQHAQEKNPV